MHINVSDILAQGEGYWTSFDIVDETVELDDTPLAKSLNGAVTLARTQDGIALEGGLTTAVLLECHRCLREFAFPEGLKLAGNFSRQPQNEEDLPISQDFSIDLAPLVRQEVVLGLPIKQLCQPDCPGLDPETGQLKAK